MGCAKSIKCVAEVTGKAVVTVQAPSLSGFGTFFQGWPFEVLFMFIHYVFEWGLH